MTLKQKLTLKNLPKNGYNISKSMREAGYTEQSSKAGSQYNSLRRFTSKLDFFDPEIIKRDIASTRRLAKKAKDITNLNRIDEHRAKIAGIITEKREVDNKNPDKIIVSYVKNNEYIPKKEDAPVTP